MEVTQTSRGIYRLEGFGPKVIAAFSGRQFPNSRHSQFLHELGFSKETYTHYKQVHGKDVVRVTTHNKSHAGDADGMLTQVPGLALGILTADCVPLFFYHPESQTIGIVHAGWRGVHQKIATELAHQFQKSSGAQPGNIQAALGPAIRKCCYEVSAEFKNHFPGYYESFPGSSEKGYVDLPTILKDELLSLGFEGNNIFDSGICTSCSSDRFFSYRCENGTEERILSVIALQS